MALTANQRKRVAYMIDGYLTDRDEKVFQLRFDRAFAAMATPEEFFLYASHSHPSQSEEEWREILNHRLCDHGTALLVYWRCSPVYHYECEDCENVKYNKRKEPRGLTNSWCYLIKEIEYRYQRSDFRWNQVRFDPSKFHGFSFLRGNSKAQL